MHRAIVLIELEMIIDSLAIIRCNCNSKSYAVCKAVFVNVGRTPNRRGPDIFYEGCENI